MVEITQADDGSIDIEQFRPMSRIRVSRRELTDEEIREIRKQAQEKIHTEGLSAIQLRDEQFPLSVEIL